MGSPGTRGGLRLVNANVTSLRAHADAVFRVEADVVALQEVRLTAAAQRAMRAQARPHGWDCFWGKALDSPTGAVWGASQGGVGLLVRQGWPCKKGEVQEDDVLACTLWNSGRWLHVCLALGDGKATANLQVLYGVSGQPALNAELFSMVMEYQARLADTASIIAMDANFNLDEVESYPTAVLVALARGDLVDLDKTLAVATGKKCVSAFGWGGASSTRIDGVLADVGTAGRLTRVAAVEGLHLPGHTPLLYCLDVARAGQRVLKTARLDPFEVQERGPAVEEAIVAQLLAPHEAEWRHLLGCRDMDALWERWMWLAEEVGLALSSAELRDVSDVRPLPYVPPTVKR